MSSLKNFQKFFQRFPTKFVINRSILPVFRVYFTHLDVFRSLACRGLGPFRCHFFYALGHFAVIITTLSIFV